MLQAREVSALLSELNADGVTTSMLLTLDGAILACAGAEALPKSESAFAAIVANMWNATEACTYGGAPNVDPSADPFVAQGEGVDLMLFQLEVRNTTHNVITQLQSCLLPTLYSFFCSLTPSSSLSLLYRTRAPPHTRSPRTFPSRGWLDPFSRASAAAKG